MPGLQESSLRKLHPTQLTVGLTSTRRVRFAVPLAKSERARGMPGYSGRA